MLIDYIILWVGNIVEMAGGWHLLEFCDRQPLDNFFLIAIMLGYLNPPNFWKDFLGVLW